MTCLFHLYLPFLSRTLLHVQWLVHCYLFFKPDRSVGFVASNLTLGKFSSFQVSHGLWLSLLNWFLVQTKILPQISHRCEFSSQFHTFIETCSIHREPDTCPWFLFPWYVLENHGNKNQGQEPIHQKYKANENTSRHNPKKKQKQTINKNQVKTLCKEDSWLQNDNHR